MEELKVQLTAKELQGPLYLRQEHAGAIEVVKTILQLLKGKQGHYIYTYLAYSPLNENM